ncbi:type 4a pilus biogenesis protein PilO [Pelosinus sp. UFO1]|uniref:type 4a pilus biogenesis protein PilO n=1 Tax=Pelosinus sp. UFO1 TaxID=484770 RepID=UPI0004D1721F|nr:type 4a pilus biogenesis protein PilO [Pelosinus sp. UFO1]AIF51783.1 Pilus assembly protein PilO [Pelosinus sp. UFO1]
MNSFSWNKTSNKDKVILFIASVAATTWFLYSFLLLPQWSQIEELTAQSNIERQKVKVIEEFLLLHPNVEQFALELDKKFINVDAMLPNNPGISNFLIQIEQLSKGCGVHLGHVKPTQTSNKEGYREYAIEILISGSFAQSMNFLNKLENELRFINVHTISMQAGKNNLESKILAKIYSFGVPAESSKTTDIKNN